MTKEKLVQLLVKCYSEWDDAIQSSSDIASSFPEVHDNGWVEVELVYLDEQCKITDIYLQKKSFSFENVKIDFSAGITSKNYKIIASGQGEFENEKIAKIEIQKIEMRYELKQKLKENAKKMMDNNPKIKGEDWETAFIFDDTWMNFYPTCYKNILENKEWKKRLNKIHSCKDLNEKNIKEMQSSNSSDALLMNIFCHPDLKQWVNLKNLLKVDNYNDIVFGWNPKFCNEKDYTTEIDMKIGKTIFEAKLTEEINNKNRISSARKYRCFSYVFKEISKINNIQYQLIRNILAAHKHKKNFILLVDESRVDLMKNFDIIKSIVKDNDFLQKIRCVTWQDIINNCNDGGFQNFMREKYF